MWKLGGQMSSFGWLHISDLHATVRRSLWSVSDRKKQFFADLEQLHEDSGPWDLVIVSGDLTMHGASEEFERVDELLDELCTRLRRWSSGREPCVLSVPGNHDVCRPSDPSPEALRSLRRWHEDLAVRNEFWSDPESPARRLVDRALEPYARWWSRREFPSHVRVHRGLLPGDFTATIEKDGICLGVAGLCSTFLQVTSDDYQERLAIDPLQLTIAARGDVPGWIAEHDAALLVTHHPPHWLAGNSRRQYEEAIYPPGRFCAHLSGHMHDDGHDAPPDGRSTRVELRAPSCLGLPEWETWRGDDRPRHYGYNACRLVLKQVGADLEVHRRTWLGDRIPSERVPRDRRPASRIARLNKATSQRVLERAALRDALHELYPSSSETGRGLAESAGVKLGRETGGSAVDVWHVVVSNAEQQDRLAKLVQIVLKKYPDATAIRQASDRLLATHSATLTSRGLRIDELADDLQERLRLLPPAALSAVLHMGSLPEQGSWENAARAANAVVRGAIKSGPEALARLAAATAQVLDLLGPSDATGLTMSALMALDIGDRALVDGQIPRAQKREVTRSPTPATLVKLLSGMFSDLRDFDGFVLEHFPAVYRKFTNGMSRESRARMLVRDADPMTIMASLQRDQPSAFAAHQRVLDYDTRPAPGLTSRLPSRFL